MIVDMVTKKKKPIKKKKSSPPHSHEEKLAAMAVLEAHENNIQSAANELGVHRSTLHGWKSELWEDYLEQKMTINDQNLTVQAKKIILFQQSSKLIEKSTALFEQAIDFFTVYENFEKLPPREKVSLVNVILPYVLEKRTTMGVKENTPVQQNNFFQTVYNQMREGVNGKQVIEVQES